MKFIFWNLHSELQILNSILDKLRVISLHLGLGGFSVVAAEMMGYRIVKHKGHADFELGRAEEDYSVMSTAGRKVEGRTD